MPKPKRTKLQKRIQARKSRKNFADTLTKVDGSPLRLKPKRRNA